MNEKQTPIDHLSFDISSVIPYFRFSLNFGTSDSCSSVACSPTVGVYQ